MAAIHDDIRRCRWVTTRCSPTAARRCRAASASASRLRAPCCTARRWCLDEATSALDYATEAQVYANLEPLDVTKVVIAHRVTTIAHADVIVVMRDGVFAERGTHDELLAAGGEYAALVAAGSAELRSG